MKTETEIRFRINEQQKRAILSSFKGWEHKSQRDVYFEGDFDGVLRLREVDGRQELSFKCFNDKGGWDEVETEIDVDIGALAEIFTHIGLSEKLKINKERQTVCHNDVEVNVDVVEGLGMFCELEKMGGERGELVSFAHDMGLDDVGIVNEGYVQLMEDD